MEYDARKNTLLMTFELYKYIVSLYREHTISVRFSGIFGVKLRLYSGNELKIKVPMCWNRLSLGSFIIFIQLNKHRSLILSYKHENRFSHETPQFISIPVSNSCVHDFMYSLMYASAVLMHPVETLSCLTLLKHTLN